MLGALAAAPILTIDASLPPGRAQETALAAIRADAAKQKITILALSLTDGEAIVYYSNTQYFHEPEAVDRLVRVLMADAPANIEKFRLLPTLDSVPQAEFDILRAPTERSIAQTGSYQILGEGNALTRSAAAESRSGPRRTRRLPAFLLGHISAIPPGTFRPRQSLRGAIPRRRRGHRGIDAPTVADGRSRSQHL